MSATGRPSEDAHRPWLSQAWVLEADFLALTLGPWHCPVCEALRLHRASFLGQASRIAIDALIVETVLDIVECSTDLGQVTCPKPNIVQLAMNGASMSQGVCLCAVDLDRRISYQMDRKQVQLRQKADDVS